MVVNDDNEFRLFHRLPASRLGAPSIPAAPVGCPKVVTTERRLYDPNRRKLIIYSELAFCMAENERFTVPATLFERSVPGECPRLILPT
jgi:hypothetical protein